MGWSAAIFLAGVLAAPAVIAVAAEPSAKDYLTEIQTAAVGPAASAAPTAACDNGEDRDTTGACPVVDDSTAQRGFTLFSGAMAKPRAPAVRPAPARSGTAAAVRDVRPAASTPSIRCGLLCDLQISFKAGSVQLTPDSEAKLARFAEALRDPSLARKRFEIAGHTDASGSSEMNRRLSQARAESVRSFLVAHGVEASRLRARGYGAEGLAFPNQPYDPRNRRVEARVLD